MSIVDEAQRHMKALHYAVARRDWNLVENQMRRSMKWAWELGVRPSEPEVIDLRYTREMGSEEPSVALQALNEKDLILQRAEYRARLDEIRRKLG